MYNPVRDGIEKKLNFVTYIESEPPLHLKNLVHCFWELKTLTPLSKPFNYHILPDACVNILFDQKNPNIAAITYIQLEHKVLDLGTNFHFTGIQLLPGVWQGDPKDIKIELVNEPYIGCLSLIKMNHNLIKAQNFLNKKTVLTKITNQLISEKFISPNYVIGSILKNISYIRSVKDMTKFTNLSSRQLQRIFKKTVWMSPHNFLKIIRLQLSFKENYFEYYSDQAHFIHSFKKITGYTPKKFKNKFDV